MSDLSLLKDPGLGNWTGSFSLFKIQYSLLLLIKVKKCFFFLMKPAAILVQWCNTCNTHYQSDILSSWEWFQTMLMMTWWQQRLKSKLKPSKTAFVCMQWIINNSRQKPTGKKILHKNSLCTTAPASVLHGAAFAFTRMRATVNSLEIGA